MTTFVWTDLIGVYGAIVATLVALIQIAEWQRKRRFLHIQCIECLHDDASILLISISNRGERPTTLDYVAVGWFDRSWRTPWRIDEYSSMSLKKLDDRDKMTGMGSLDGITLSPGDLVHAVVSKREVLAMAVRNEWQPKSKMIGQCILIEHSQSDSPVYRIINWHR